MPKHAKYKEYASIGRVETKKNLPADHKTPVLYIGKYEPPKNANKN